MKGRKRWICGVLVAALLFSIIWPAGTPVRGEEAERKAAMVSMSETGGAAVAEDGTLWTWGDNGSGRLGDGSFASRNYPAKVMEEVSFAETRADYTAAVKKDGSLWTWGDNTFGQLGTGSKAASTTPLKVMDNVSQISLAKMAAAAVTTDGKLYTWGNNARGQLGNGTTTSERSPVEILDNVAKVCLEETSLGAAIQTDGTLYVWGGAGTTACLGDGKSTGSKTPAKIMAEVSDVAFGKNFMAVLKKDGSVFVWGENKHGQLGNGTTDPAVIPFHVMDEAVKITACDNAMAVLKEDGSLYAWGQNTFYDSLPDSLIPVKIFEHVTDVRLGNGWAAMLQENEDLYLWGSNYFGDDTPESAAQEKIFAPVASFDQASGCGALISGEGGLYTWGNNDLGQLGNGENDNVLFPAPISLRDGQTGYDNGEIRWQIEGDTLTISAVPDTRGRMVSYGSNGNAPWLSSRKIINVKKVVIESGVTELGRHALVGMNLESLIIRGSVAVVPQDFCRNGKITTVTFDAGVNAIDSLAFRNTQIRTLYIAKTVEDIDERAFYCLIANGGGHYIEHVYGYTGSAAEKFVSIMNAIPRDMATETWGNFTAPQIVFHPVTSTAKVVDMRRVRENSELITAATTEGTGNYTLYLTDSEGAQLKNLVYMPENAWLTAFELGLQNAVGNEAADFGSCVITMPVPTLMDSADASVQVLAVSPYGTLERPNAERTFVNNVPCIRFTATHFSEYGFLYTPKDPAGGGSGAGDSGSGDSGSGSGGSSSGDSGSGSGNVPAPDETPETDEMEYMYRMYNRNTGEHFYTRNIFEKDHLSRNGWQYEGIAWSAPTGGVAVYRLYNPNNGDHHYTRDKNESAILEQFGWKYEGIGWRSSKKDLTPVYRLYNPNCKGAGSHHYTPDLVERNALVKLGWTYEGVGWYGL